MAIARDLEQIYGDNPSTTVGDNDLIYIAKSPYGDTDDSGIKYSDLYTQMGIAYQLKTLTDDFSLGQDSDLFKLTNGASPALGDTLYSTDENGEWNFYTGGNFNGAFNVNNPLVYNKFYLAGGPRYNDDLSLSASQSGTIVTGTGTAFNANMQGGFIRWPSSGNLQKIVQVNSATSLTVSGSHTQTSAPFIIYFAGYNYDYTANIFTIKNLETISIDTFLPYLVLDIGQTNAQLVRVGRSGSVVYGGEKFCTGQTYNSDLSLSASQSGSTVTGSGTAFTTDMINARIFWPSTGNNAQILTVDSATQLTVDESFSQTSAPFYIYYGGLNTQPSSVSMSPLIPFYVNKIDTDTTIKTLQIGSVNADFMLVNCGIGYLPNYQDTSPYTCTLRDTNILFSFSGGGTINLYADPYAGMYVKAKDILGNAGTNPTTIDGNGKTIDGSSTFDMDADYAAAGFYFGGTEWHVF